MARLPQVTAICPQLFLSHSPDEQCAILSKAVRPPQLDRLNRNIPNNAPQFDCPRVQHRALSLDTANDREIVNLAGNHRQRLAVITLGRLMIETLRIADSDNPRLPDIVAAVRRKSRGVNGVRPSNAQMPGVPTLPSLCVVPFNAPDMACRATGHCA
jgi:hypothetical protein